MPAPTRTHNTGTNHRLERRWITSRQRLTADLLPSRAAAEPTLANQLVYQLQVRRVQTIIEREPLILIALLESTRPSARVPSGPLPIVGGLECGADRGPFRAVVGRDRSCETGAKSCQLYCADRGCPFGLDVGVDLLDVLKEAGVKGNLSAFTEAQK